MPRMFTAGAQAPRAAGAGSTRVEVGARAIAPVVTKRAAHKRAPPPAVASEMEMHTTNGVATEAVRVALLQPTVFSAKRYVHDFLEEPLVQKFPRAKFFEVRSIACLQLLAAAHHSAQPQPPRYNSLPSPGAAGWR